MSTLLNIFKYFDKPTELNQSELIEFMSAGYLRMPMRMLADDPEAKEKLAPGINLIKLIPYTAYDYALHIIKDRWYEAEPYIMKDPSASLEYARHVIKGRWPEAEQYILKDPYYAFPYAKSVIKGRWPEAEADPVFKKSSEWKMYKKHFGI
jgi:hypothetical protein